MSSNVLSVSMLIDSGVKVDFTTEGCSLRNSENKILLKPRRYVDGLYRISNTDLQQKCMMITTKVTPYEWHQRLGHLSLTGMLNMSKSYDIKELKTISEEEVKRINECKGCLKGKAHRKAMPKLRTTKTSKVLELIHSDICGPMSVMTAKGCRYFITFIDDYTRFMTVMFIRNRSEALECLRKYKIMMETQTGQKIKCLRSDGAKEYLSNEFNHFLSENGILRQVTPPYTPEHNGVAERANRTLVESARSMIMEKSLDLKLWAEAVNTACYIRNLCTTRSLQENQTPYEMLYGRKASLDHLRPFGSTCYVHVPKERRKKWDTKTIKCTFVGYSTQSKAYRFIRNDKDELIVSRDSSFVNEENDTSKKAEEEGDKKNPGQQQNQQETRTELILEPVEEDTDSDSTILDTVSESASQPQVDTTEYRRWQDLIQNSRSGQNTRYGSNFVGNRRKSARFNHQTSYRNRIMVTKLRSEPTTYEEAMNADDSKDWKEAMQNEYDSILAAGTWKLVPLPADQQTVGCKWVFKIKENADGTVNRYKARLVAKGYSQQVGVNYEETFAPVAKYQSIRALLALATIQDMEIHQMDVVCAFLHGDIEEDVYMDQPEGFEVKGKEHLVCKLKKSLYGLKQASRAWYRKMDNALLDRGFQRFQSDHCIYKYDRDKMIIYVILYVDDLIIMTNSKEELGNLKNYLNESFKMKDLGEIQNIVGLQIKRDRSKKLMQVHQEKFTHDLLVRYQMENCKAVGTPLENKTKLHKRDSNTEAQGNIKRYQSIIGSLLYLVRGTRSDIAYAVTKLSQYSSDPSTIHEQALKRVLRYIRGTSNYCLEYKASNGSNILQAFTDSDWGGDVDSRRSMSGYVFLFGGGAVNWSSKTQATVALSSVEAEYAATTHAAKEAIWLSRLLREAGHNLSLPITIFSDSQGSIALAKNPEFHARTKHIEIKHHFIRERVQDGIIRLEYIPTNDMLADQLTKPLSIISHNKLVKLMGVTRYTL
jgi:transposase InsO family protein